MTWLANLLSHGWWQGVAGIAQILAAILSMITVIQARKTIAQADEEQRKLSVAPDWEVVEQSSKSYTTGSNMRIARIALLNSGSGPGRHSAIRFEPRNDNRPSRISPGIQGAKGRYSPSSVVPPMHLLTIRRTWCIDKPLDGLLILTYETRFGERKDVAFPVRTRSDDRRQPHREVTAFSTV